MKKLEQKKINELKLLEEEIFFMTLRNKHLGRSSYDIIEEEIDLEEQVKKKVGKIEELKEDVEWESKTAKMLQDLNYEKNDEIVATSEIKSGILKELISFLKISIIPRKYLHLVLEKQLKNT